LVPYRAMHYSHDYVITCLRQLCDLTGDLVQREHPKIAVE